MSTVFLLLLQTRALLKEHNIFKPSFINGNNRSAAEEMIIILE